MGDVAAVIGGSTPRTDRPEYFGGDIPWITPADLSKYTEKTISYGARNITKEGLEHSGARLLPAGTVLFSTRAPIGYVAIASTPVATNQGFKSFVLKDDVIADYAFYYLQHARQLAIQMASGTTFLELSGKKAAQIPIPVPPLPEQHRIVAEIEKQFSRLDEGVAALKRVQANLKRYRAAVLKAACEGKLVPTEAELQKRGSGQSGSGVSPLKQSRDGSATFESGEQLLKRILAERRQMAKVAEASRLSSKGKQSRDGSATFESGEALLKRILAERRQKWQGRGKYKEPVAPNTTTLPKLPEGWTWAVLEAVSEAVGGFAFSSTKFVESGYQVVKMANIRMGKIDLTQRPSFISEVPPDVVDKFTLREGDLVVTLTGTRKKRDYGYVAVVKTEEGLLLNQRIARLRPFPGIDSKFIQIAMQAEHYRDRFFSHETGNVGQGNVGIAAVTREMVPLPPLAEQKRIVEEVERRLSVIDELESVVASNLQRAVRLRQAVLQKAFRGELV